MCVCLRAGCGAACNSVALAMVLIYKSSLKSLAHNSLITRGWLGRARDFLIASWLESSPGLVLYQTVMFFFVFFCYGGRDRPYLLLINTSLSAAFVFFFPLNDAMRRRLSPWRRLSGTVTSSGAPSVSSVFSFLSAAGEGAVRALRTFVGCLITLVTYSRTCGIFLRWLKALWRFSSANSYGVFLSHSN